jgi:hypothetical protein
VLSTNTTFLRFWLTESCRNAVLRNVERETLPALRLVCHNFASTTAPFMFNDLSIDFKVSSFTKPGKIATLHRIGRHARKLTFKAPHAADAFLPPLLNPLTGDQLAFAYVPQLHTKSPKYGSYEMDDLLIQQYPPIFHAATNIPSFIRALSAMPNLEHISIHSPDQASSQRYRKSSADYALTSLRIAIEHTQLANLHSLSLHQLHPQALRNLLPMLNHGSSPSSCRRWTQIRKLHVQMDPLPRSLAKPEDQIRLIQTYLRAFATSLLHLSFRWTGEQPGPSPLFLSHEPTIWTPSLGQYEYRGQQHQHTANRSFPPPTPPKDSRFSPVRPELQRSASTNSKASKPLRFIALQYLDLQNCALEAEQLAAFITRHRSTLVEFRFEDVSLRGGNWASTLEPLRILKRLERSRAAASLAKLQAREAAEAAAMQMDLDAATDVDDETEMDVPCMFVTPTEEVPRGRPWAEERPAKRLMVDEGLIIMDTLEPQPRPQMTQPLTRRKWFGSSASGNGGRRHERKVSDHLRRLVNGGLFTWR